jgi:transposase InsO family protein
MLQGLLLGEGHKIGRRHVATLMKRMGIMAIYRRPNTSKPEPGHKIFPYLLRKLSVIQPNQVWAMDITYRGGLVRLNSSVVLLSGFPPVVTPPPGSAWAG